MRVLHVIPSVAPRYGGPSQAVLGMCRALRAADVDAEIATTDADGPKGRLARAERSAAGVPLHVFHRMASESWKYSRELAQWLDAHAADYDVLHVHGVFSHATAAACRAARRCDVPVVLRPCGMLAPYSLRQSGLRKSVYWRLVERSNVRSARCLHATAPGEAAELGQLLPGQSVRCVPLGLETAAFDVPHSDGAFRRRHGIPADRPMLLFLSRLHRKKGLVDFVLPALARLPAEVTLLVVGDRDPHDPDHEAHVVAAARALGVTDRVRFIGPLYGTDKWAAYDEADVYLLPSRHENFGATAVEAAARGVPSVLSHEVQAAPLAVEAGAAVAVPLELPAIIQAAEGLLGLSAEERAAIRRACRQFALRQLSWSTVAERLIALYHDVGGAVGRRRTETTGAQSLCRV